MDPLIKLFHLIVLVELICQQHAVGEHTCFHEPVQNMTLGVNVHGSSGPEKRQATNFEPFRVRFSYQDSGIGSRSQTLALQRVLGDIQSFLASALSVIPATVPLLLGRDCVLNLIPLPIRERTTCYLQCEPVTRCGPIFIPQSDLQGCDQCDGDATTCTQTSLDGAGVANADMVMYYTFSFSDNTCASGNTIAYSSACQLESQLDRPIAGYIVFCLGLFNDYTEEELFKIALHEITHSLGFSSALFKFFRDENGIPRSPRDANGFTLSDTPSTNTIRQEVYTDWMTISGPQIRSVSLMVTPNVLEQAAIHFGCSSSSLHGIELENDGGSGTAGSHWEARVMGDEYMVGVIRTPSPISRITLALLEDSGWYRANYEAAEAFAYGSQAGCRFPHGSCLEHVNNQITSGQNLRPFCNVLSDLPGNFHTCSTDRNYIAQCDLSVLDFNLPSENQYFSSGANFGPETPDEYFVDTFQIRIGGTSEVNDYCPYHKPMLSNACFDAGNQIAVNVEGQTYGPESRCFEHGRQWTQTSIVNNIPTSTEQGAGCYQYSCTSSGVEIYFLGLRLQCNCEGEELVVNTTVGNSHYQGSLICPSCGALCYDNLEICDQEPAPCPGRVSAAAINPCENGGIPSYMGNDLYSCECAPGYEGKNCTIDIDDCLSSPCQNGGTCIDRVNEFSCECVAGFIGQTCSTNRDDCSPNPCLHGATCTDLVNGFSCACTPGYTGERCETNIDDCASNPCDNGGRCVDEINAFKCVCAPGYTGETCQTDINECESNPCRNGGTCTDLVNRFSCDCVAGYTGDNCAVDINDCEPSPCNDHGICVDHINAFSCVCDNGFTGETCSINIDDCESNPCENGGLCVDGVDEFSCLCPENWAGRRCQDCTLHGCMCSVLSAIGRSEQYCLHRVQQWIYFV